MDKIINHIKSFYGFSHRYPIREKYKWYNPKRFFKKKEFASDTLYKKIESGVVVIDFQKMPYVDQFGCLIHNLRILMPDSKSTSFFVSNNSNLSDLDDKLFYFENLKSIRRNYRIDQIYENE